MSGVQTTIFIALQAQRGQLRRNTGFGHGKDFDYIGAHSNRLADLQDAAQSPGGLETSPYLLQHCGQSRRLVSVGRGSARPWRNAKTSRFLLSVGYSACHWCHVMAHESFEDPDTAALMNRLVRQHQSRPRRATRPGQDLPGGAATHHAAAGGWPLTMFLTPEDQQPFFGGTYFPKEPRHGMPGFSEILRRVAEYFRDSRGRDPAAERAARAGIRAAHAGRRRASDRRARCSAAGRSAARRSNESFDSRSGGFGGAPKFPHPASIERCLRDWHATSRAAGADLQALHMATLTLTRMAEGGIYDQLGGGFSRYSVDDAWMIPHFEKMLYDNGQLLGTYASGGLGDR